MLNPTLKTQLKISPISNNNSMQQLSTTQNYQWGEIKLEKEEENK